MSDCYTELKDVSILLEDWFMKSPPTDQMHRDSSWYTRYFVLTAINCQGSLKSGFEMQSKKGKTLFSELNEFYVGYWDSKLDFLKKRKPIRVIPVTKDSTIHIQDHPHSPEVYVHTLAFQSEGRKFFLCSRYEKEMRGWFHVLAKLIEITIGRCDWLDSMYRGSESVHASTLPAYLPNCCQIDDKALIVRVNTKKRWSVGMLKKTRNVTHARSSSLKETKPPSLNFLKNSFDEDDDEEFDRKSGSYVEMGTFSNYSVCKEEEIWTVKQFSCRKHFKQPALQKRPRLTNL